MANGAKVCSETCEHDLGEDTTVARTECGSQHVLSTKPGQGGDKDPAPATLASLTQPGADRGTHPCFQAQTHLSLGTPALQLRSHICSSLHLVLGRKLLFQWVFLIEHNNQRFISNNLPSHKFCAHSGGAVTSVLTQNFSVLSQ